VSFARFSLIIVTTLLFVMGLLMIFNTSSAEVLDLSLSRSTHQSLVRQIFYAMAGCIIAMALWVLGYRQVLRLSGFFLAVLTALLVLTLIPGVGHKVNGARRWIGFAGISFQPSEWVKFALPFYWVDRYLQQGEITLPFFLKMGAVALVPLSLIMLQPNTGTCAVIGLTLMVVCFLTRVPFKYWGVPTLTVLLVGSALAYHMPHVSSRLRVYRNPELDIQGKGHQPRQSKIAAGSGQLLGKGPGRSLQKLSYLPEAQNDYIAAIFAEEYGFLGMLLLISLYTGIALIGFQAALFARDLAGFYMAAIIAFLISFQAFLNMGVVSGLLPSTGLNLPLFSQGGTSLVANIMALGLLLNIIAESEAAKNHPHPSTLS
jgi:cell division protein FtsW